MVHALYTYLRTAKALARLRGSAASPEHSLVDMCGTLRVPLSNDTAQIFITECDKVLWMHCCLIQ